MARRKRKMNGKGPVLDWIKKAARSAHNFIKDNRLISRGATALAPLTGSYSGAVSNVGRAAAALGYGRKRKRKGRKKK